MKLVLLALGALALITLASTINEDYVLVPSGRMVHKSCVHAIPDGATVVANLDRSHSIMADHGMNITFPRCKFPAKSTRRMAAATFAGMYYQNPSVGISTLYGEWVVPPNPTGLDGQTLFYWNGVEDSSYDAVLQPVLQFGRSYAGGGNDWEVACWYVDNSGTALFSTLLKVTAGDTILGNNVVQADGTWAITGTSKTLGKSTSLKHKPTSGSLWDVPMQILETYNIVNCVPDYPSGGTMTFNNIKVTAKGKQITPKWQQLVQNANCGESAAAASATQTSVSWETS